MNEPKLAQVFHFDLQGKRDFKYDFLNENTLSSIQWNELQPVAPNFFLVKKDFDESGAYERGFKMDELFSLNSTGIKTHRDELVIDFSADNLKQRITEFYDLSIDDNLIAQKFELKDNRDWTMSVARKAVKLDKNKIKSIDFRPFDKRFCYYESSLIDYGREKIMNHFLRGNNLGIVLPKQVPAQEKVGIIVTKILSAHKLCSAYNINNTFPLYLYPEPTNDLFANTERTPNLNSEIIKQIADGLGLKFTNESVETGQCPVSTRTTFAPIDVLDYIYAVLHSPTYREKYKEFLKIDFPRVPYPKQSPLTPNGGIKEVQEKFWKLVKLGGEIRQIHLLESDVVEEYITQYPVSGNDVVVKITAPQPATAAAPMGEFTRVYINDSQYFDRVPLIAWNFYIGGYQPAQKWLKDRKDRVLSFEDILHYQKIIVALTETARLMEEIDLVGVE